MSQPTFIVAEAGSNWKGTDDEQATADAMIDAAARAGVDAVKFQVFRGHLTYATAAGPCAHLKDKGISGDIHTVFRQLEMSDVMVGWAAERCARRGVEFMASYFSERDFHAVDPYVRRHKIASPELHDPFLLRLAAKSGKPILLSTGMSTLDEVAWALGQLSDAGASEVTLLHCTVQYPTSPGAVNLRRLKLLRRRFRRPVGLSDHSRDPVIAPTAAVALGVVCVEKHFTLDNSLKGPDQSWAITAEELGEMVQAIRNCELMLGVAQEGVSPEEEPLRRFSRRSVQALAAVRRGEPLELGKNIAVLRPGNNRHGVHPSLLTRLEGRLARRDIQPGDGIQQEDWDESPTARL